MPGSSVFGVFHVLRFVWRAFGSGGHIHLRNVVGLHDLERFEIVCTHPLPLQLDGDYVGEDSRFAFSSAPASLNLIA